MSAKNPQSLTSNAAFQAGSRVDVDYKGQGRWFPGWITKDRGDGTFNIQYDDGDKERRVPEDRIVPASERPEGIQERQMRSSSSSKGW